MKQYFSFQWHITDECDQRCKHCYIFSGDPCRKLDSMTWEFLKFVMNLYKMYGYSSLLKTINAPNITFYVIMYKSSKVEYSNLIRN